MRRALLLGAAVLALPLCAAAQNIDLSQGGPVDVTATDGIEWRQAEQVVIARGNARAVRAGVTVDADRLLARYRPAGQQPGQPAATRPASQQAAAPMDAAPGGNNEIWRLEAEGRVKITTATDTARGDRAVYDIDQAVLVLTGRDLSLTTPSQVITAKDSLEYWSQKRMAVARGGAVVTEPAENRRVAGDTLVAYFLEGAGGPGAPPPAPRPALAPGEKEPPGAGRMDRVEAYGNVEIRTATEVVRGDRGVYNAQTGMARLLGDVRITRGDNQINGREAIVNMRTGVARLVSSPGARVQGLIVPNQQEGAAEKGQPDKSQPAPGAGSVRIGR
ncbi:LptA/OstA family protein [Dankookia sp. P2]|uniref:LptA/OstA family protein n=1 Tax=Dankookia sp. P2 TaxID=3423955 RepID=UPI003D66BA8E